MLPGAIESANSRQILGKFSAKVVNKRPNIHVSNKKMLFLLELRFPCIPFLMKTRVIDKYSQHLLSTRTSSKLWANSAALLPFPSEFFENRH